MATLIDHKAEILQGVNYDAWRPLFDEEAFDEALAAIPAAQVTPPPHLILEALRYGTPADFHSVIIGQDPYPTPGNAKGLCFSVPRGVAIPESLKRVFGCLDRAGLRVERRDTNTLCSGDLRSWAVQGVLMINASLTTTLGATRAHANIWTNFIGTFIERLCETLGKQQVSLNFLLWGNDARRHAATARQHGHRSLEWSHPSPMADNKLPPDRQFRMCPHFEEVNAALKAVGRRPVIWDNAAPVVAFSDGSCPLNGKPKARAGFAAAIAGGPFGSRSSGHSFTLLYGEVQPLEYEFIDVAAPDRGLRVTKVTAVPSNNRGELMGLAYCILALLWGRAQGQIEIVSDSEICIKTMLEWLPTRLAKGTERELKNYDLVFIIWTLLETLRAQATSVALTHTNSHQKAPPASAPVRERMLWAGNDLADRHADKVLSAPPDYKLRTVGPPPIFAAYIAE